MLKCLSSIPAASNPYRRPGLDFLGSSCFPGKTLNSEGWISLDFLGFSRADRAISEGCAGFSLDKISRSYYPRQPRRSGSRSSEYAEAQDCSWGKLSLVSNFPQWIVARAFL